MNKILHYQNPVNNINVKDNKFLELVWILVTVQDHWCTITEDLLYIINSKLLKLLKFEITGNAEPSVGTDVRRKS